MTSRKEPGRGQGPLAGLRVLDIATVVAAPSALRRSRVTRRLPRLVTFHHRGLPSLCGGKSRIPSPAPGSSALTTLAP